MLIKMNKNSHYGLNCILSKWICWSLNSRHLRNVTVFGDGVFEEVIAVNEVIRVRCWSDRTSVPIKRDEQTDIQRVNTAKTQKKTTICKPRKEAFKQPNLPTPWPWNLWSCEKMYCRLSPVCSISRQPWQLGSSWNGRVGLSAAIHGITYFPLGLPLHLGSERSQWAHLLSSLSEGVQRDSW